MVSPKFFGTLLKSCMHSLFANSFEKIDVSFTLMKKSIQISGAISRSEKTHVLEPTVGGKLGDSQAHLCGARYVLSHF